MQQPLQHQQLAGCQREASCALELPLRRRRRGALPRTCQGRLLAGVWAAVGEAAAAARPPQREPTELPLLPCQTPLRTPLRWGWHRVVAGSLDTAAAAAALQLPQDHTPLMDL